jgi:hypothetical protein
MGAAARDAASRWSWDEVLAAHLELYDELAGAAPAGRPLLGVAA